MKSRTVSPVTALACGVVATGDDTWRLCVRGAFFLVVLVFIPHPTPAKLARATLAELVQNSEVIATGHFPAAPTHRHLTTLNFRLTWLVKGGKNAPAVEIPFCNPDTDVEYPDLNDANGDLLLFLAKTGRCYSLVWGYTAFVPIENGQAQTSRIDDQPKEQPVGKFIKKIQSLMGAHAKITVYPLRPCEEVLKLPSPVVNQCAAAAVAERAFREETQRKFSTYTMFAMQQTETRWYFNIELGDAKSPAGPGESYMVAVDRRTGAATVTPGK